MASTKMLKYLLPVVAAEQLLVADFVPQLLQLPRPLLNCLQLIVAF